MGDFLSTEEIGFVLLFRVCCQLETSNGSLTIGSR